jgi:RimJ/RimL family protein N-acetyltransferase
LRDVTGTTDEPPRETSRTPGAAAPAGFARAGGREQRHPSSAATTQTVVASPLIRRDHLPESARIRAVHCALRKVRDVDLAVLFDQWADPVAARMAAFTAPDHMDRDAFDRRWSRLRADETTINRVIVVEGEVAGTIGSWGDPDEREVTYWIGRSYWGKGIATCALDAFFLTVDPSRPLHARVAYDNVASRRVLEKCGFRVIATERGFAEARSREIEEVVLRLDGA